MAARVLMAPAMATTPQLLPHQLVPRDGRSSYIKRVDTLAGPGAYAIPSSFKMMEMNLQIREIHKQHYGRDFARQQRHASSADGLETTPCDDIEGDIVPDAARTKQERRDIFLARRERLRELLERLDERRYQPGCSDAPMSPTIVTPFKSEQSLPQSPSLSCTSNYEVFVEGYRQHKPHGRHNGRAGSCTRTESVRSPTSPTDLESVGFPVSDSPSRQRSGSMKRAASPATSPALAPLTYREYLATTSYSKRLSRQSHHQQQQHTRRPSSAAGSTNHGPHHQ